MGGVGIDAIGAARRNNPDGLLVVQHGAHLHRRRVGAQHMRRPVGLRRHIERVLHLAGRVVGGNVQLGEIVIVEFHVRAFGHGETHIGEDSGDFFQHLGNGMHAALRLGAGRQGDVDLFRGQPRIQRRVAQCGFACRNRVGHRIAQAVEHGPLGFAVLRAHGAQSFHQFADAALLAQRGNAHGFQRGFIAGGGNLSQNVGLQRRDVGHQNPERRRVGGMAPDSLRWSS